MANVRVIIWDEENYLQRISVPEDCFLIEVIDASGSDENVIKIGPFSASSVAIGREGISTFVSGVLSGNFITGAFYGDASQVRGVVTLLNDFTGSVKLVAGANVSIISGSGQITISASPSASSGLSASEHRDLDQLVHGLSENSFDDLSYILGGRVSNVTTWTNSSKTLKIRELQVSYIGNTNKLSSSILYQYDSSGLVVEKLTEFYMYATGSKIYTVDRIYSGTI